MLEKLGDYNMLTEIILEILFDYYVIIMIILNFLLLFRVKVIPRDFN